METAPPRPSESATDTSQRNGFSSFVLPCILFLGVAGASFVFLQARQPTTPKKPASANGAVESETRVTDASEASDSNAKSDRLREPLLENVGSVSTIYLYQTYLNLGLIADAVENKSYDAQQGTEMTTTVVALIRTVDAQMAKLENIGLSKEDVESIGQVRDISKLLKSQIDHLQTYWRTGDRSSLENYYQVRRQSWRDLQAVLGWAESAKK